MRLVASIAPWLPWIKGILPYSVLLGGKASELYYFSILEKSTPPLLLKRTLFGMPQGGKAVKAFHEHLLHQGFRKSALTDPSGEPRPAYYREDLGYLEFHCPPKGTRKNPHQEGLLSVPDPWVELLLEDPHQVELKYMGNRYGVRIPQTGRLVLVNGLQLRTKKKAAPEEAYRASQALVQLLYLLVLHEELEEEALNDLAEVKPTSLLREFQQNLRDHGPGTAVWEGAQKFYLELFPEVKAVQLNSWYWKFIPKITKVMEQRRLEK